MCPSFSFYVYGYIAYLHRHLCATGMPSAHGGWKRVLDPLHPEVQMVSSLHMDAGIKPESTERAISAHIHWIISPGFEFLIGS